jgi:hypothetical protein
VLDTASATHVNRPVLEGGVYPHTLPTACVGRVGFTAVHDRCTWGQPRNTKWVHRPYHTKSPIVSTTVDRISRNAPPQLQSLCTGRGLIQNGPGKNEDNEEQPGHSRCSQHAVLIRMMQPTVTTTTAQRKNATKCGDPLRVTRHVPPHRHSTHCTASHLPVQRLLCRLIPLHSLCNLSPLHS